MSDEDSESEEEEEEEEEEKKDNAPVVLLNVAHMGRFAYV